MGDGRILVAARLGSQRLQAEHLQAGGEPVDGHAYEVLLQLRMAQIIAQTSAELACLHVSAERGECPLGIPELVSSLEGASRARHLGFQLSLLVR